MVVTLLVKLLTSRFKNFHKDCYDVKEKLAWFTLFGCSLLDFTEIVPIIVPWISLCFFVNFIFCTKSFFRTNIFSSKEFSWGFGRLPFTNFFKYLEQKTFFYSRGLIHNSQHLFNSQILRNNFWKCYQY